MVGPASPQPKQGLGDFGEASSVSDGEDDEEGIPGLEAVIPQPCSCVPLLMGKRVVDC